MSRSRPWSKFVLIFDNELDQPKGLWRRIKFLYIDNIVMVEAIDTFVVFKNIAVTILQWEETSWKTFEKHIGTYLLLFIVYLIYISVDIYAATKCYWCMQLIM